MTYEATESVPLNSKHYVKCEVQALPCTCTDVEQHGILDTMAFFGCRIALRDMGNAETRTAAGLHLQCGGNTTKDHYRHHYLDRLLQG